MSYVDARYDRDKNIVQVVERVDGERVFKDFVAEYTFYYNDAKGKQRSANGDSVRKFTTNSGKEFQKEKRMHGGLRLWESDFQPIGRCLEKNYLGVASPNLHVAFFDIETDFDKELGWSEPEDALNPITAISTYLNWSNTLVTQVIAPKTLTAVEAQVIVDKFENTILYTDEKKLLSDFLDIIQDADVLSGWNSTSYDIPYTVNRITKVLSKNDTRRFCLWDKYPKKRTFEMYGKENQTYDLIGRVHLDYLDLYRKYTYQEQHSYSLDAISEFELGERKVEYDGSLDHLYNYDFEKFISYSRQDTALLNKLDLKLKFIDLASAVAHENTVVISKAMGTVALVEQAIINESHRLGVVAPDKVREREESTKAAGAYVAYPRKGLHKWVGSVDINSLYPSAIQALNMSPETIVGQLRPVETEKYIDEKMADKIVNGKTKKGCNFAASWEGLFSTLEYTAVMDQREDVMITIDWEGTGNHKYASFGALAGESELTAAQVYDLIFGGEVNWALTANGTIFTYEKEGIIPGLLKRWYAERKVLQGKKKQAIKDGDKVQTEHWDKMQHVKKILLNSLYGALLNGNMRYYDKRIGQSTTLAGRTIAKHMHSKVNEDITGVYDYDGDAIVYGDTDSSYFSVWPMIKDDVEAGKQDWNVDMAITLYDGLADQLNESFPPFMKKAFNAPQQYGEIIQCGREVVASSGLFITKKRYALMVADNEGQRCDVDGKAGKLKAMGLDLKRSDTPAIVQDFLKDILHTTLVSEDKEKVIEQILDFKKMFADLKPWEKGTPKRINKLTKYTNEEDAARALGGKARLPGHTRAGYNFNKLRKMHSDNYTMAIIDGAKTIVCKLKENHMGMNSVAIPTDEHNIPDWFKELPFDEEVMMATIVTKKIDNLLGILKWDIEDYTNTSSTFGNLFEF